MTLILSGSDGLSDVDGSAATPAIRGTDANTGIFFPAADTIAFSEGGAEVMRINSSGFVGIGTTTPTRALTVVGTWTNTGDYLMDSSSPQLAWTSGDLRFKYGGLGGTEAMRIDSSGNVGIGTSSPVAASLLTLKKTSAGGDGAELRLINSSTTVETATQIVFTNTTTDSGNSAVIKVARTSGGQDFRFASDGTERARIDSSGNLLVGTTNTGLTNANAFAFQPASAGSAYANHVNGSSSGNGYIFFGYNGGSIGSITQNGTTAVAYNTTSDYRLKENIAPLTGALARVAALKPCTYTWKFAPNETGEGFIAHELAEICPQATTGAKDAVDAEGNPQYQGIDTSFLVATLTAAIQELKAIVDAQAARITALEAA